ncbi:MAG: hypothetical protein QY307_07250 [Acidimicrobiia bacterium]|nr:MAG: hypothetical protein QY307_07250 [Acidimicrobiia bacterium]
MRITILGWGSLVWNPGSLPIDGPWQGTGPVLPLEFSRVSRDGRLTLVIDREHGDPCQTYSVLSQQVHLGDAIGDLCRREETEESRIGFVDLESGDCRGRDDLAVKAIKAWAEAGDIDGVVWTDLEPNFEMKSGAAFSVTSAIRYIDGLPATNRAKAIEYIARAPANVSTPFRRAWAIDA